MSIFNESSHGGDLSIDNNASSETFVNNKNNKTPNSKEYYVLIHVEAGETFSVGRGDRVQHISGPATIRMISNRGPPSAIPMEVPPGHLVQQIVDDDGILTHVIISAYRSITDKFDKKTCKSVKIESDQENSDGYDASIPNSENIKIDLEYTLSLVNNKIDGSNDKKAIDTQKLLLPDKTKGQKAYFDNKKSPVQSSETNARSRKKYFKNSKIEDVDVNRKRRDWVKPKTISNPCEKLKDPEMSLENNFPDQGLIMNLLSDLPPPSVLEIKATSVLIAMKTPSSLDPLTDPKLENNNNFNLDETRLTYNLYLAESKSDNKLFSCIYKGTKNTKLIHDLKPWTNYTVKYACSYEITENSSIILGQMSELTSFKTETSIPSSPKKLTLVQKSRNSFSIKWSPASDHGSKITDYLVQYSQEPKNESAKIDWRTGYRGAQKSCKLNQLNTQTKYLTRVCAFNSNGKGPWSDVLRVTTFGSPPQVPSRPKLVQADVHSLLVAWNSVKAHNSHLEPMGNSDEVQYVLDISDDCMKGDFVTVYQGSASEHCIENLRRNSDYSFRVAAFNNDGQSKWSETSSYRTKSDVSSPPLNLRMQDNNICYDQFELLWDKPEDSGGSQITRYRLEINLPINTYSNNEHRDLSSLPPTDSIHLHISTDSPSGPSKKYSVQRNTFNNPEIPTLLTHWPGVSLNSEMISDDLIIGCDSFHCTASKSLIHDIQTQWKDLTRNYIYPVLCVDSINLVKDFDWNWKDVPHIFQKTYDSDTDIINSDQNSLHSLDSSDLNRRGWFIIYEGPHRCVKIDNLPRCKEIYFRVRASNNLCLENTKKKFDSEWTWSKPCQPLLRIIAPAKAPGPEIDPPELVNVKQKSISLKWKPPYDTGGDEIINYQLFVQDNSLDDSSNDDSLNTLSMSGNDDLQRLLPSGISVVYSGKETEFTIDGLKSSIKYSFYIRAGNNYGWTLFSQALVHTTFVIPPDAPQFAPRCQVKASDHIFIQWDEVTNINGGRIIEYRLECSAKKNFSLANRHIKDSAKHGSGSSLSYQEENTSDESECKLLKPDEDDQFELIYSGPELFFDLYQVKSAMICKFRYCAINNQGSSEYSPVSICTTLGSCPDQPSSLLVTTNRPRANPCLDFSPESTSSNLNINITWHEPDSNGAEITSYQLELKQIDLTDDTTIEVIDVPANVKEVSIDKNIIEYNIDYLRPNSRYQVRVRAKNSFGFGPYSGGFKFITPPPLPSKPILEATKISSDSIRLKWLCSSSNSPSTNKFNGEDGYTNLNVKVNSNCVPIHSNKNFYVLQMLSNSKNPSKYFCRWQTIYQGYHTFHKISRLKESTEYSFRVLAIHQSVTGPYSEPIVIITEKQAPAQCKKVTNPKIIELTSNSVTLEWPTISMHLLNSSTSDPVESMGQHDINSVSSKVKDRLLYSVQMVSVKSSQSNSTVRSTPWHPSQVSSYEEVYFDSLNRCKIMNLMPMCEYIVRVCAVRQFTAYKDQTLKLSKLTLNDDFYPHNGEDQMNEVNQSEYSSSDDEPNIVGSMQRNHRCLRGPYSQGLLFTCPANVTSNEVDSSPKHKMNPGVLLNPSITEVLFSQKSTRTELVKVSRQIISESSNNQNASHQNSWLGHLFNLVKSPFQLPLKDQIKSVQTCSKVSCSPVSMSTGRRKSFSDTYKACFCVLVFILVAFALTRVLDVIIFPIKSYQKPGVNANTIMKDFKIKPIMEQSWDVLRQET